MSISRGKSCSISRGNLRFGNQLAKFPEHTHNNEAKLAGWAIAEYHDLLAAVRRALLQLSRSCAARCARNRLLYGDRTIGIALRPHLLDEKQFHALTYSAELLASALEKVATALVRSSESYVSARSNGCRMQSGTYRSGVFNGCHNDTARAIRSRGRNQICRIQRRESVKYLGSGGIESRFI